MRLKFWQYHSREWIDFWRTDTGEHVDERLLEFGSQSIADMPDVGFHLTGHGQAEITVDGVSYRMQIYPPSLTNNEATPERMVAEMDLAGVDIGVLQSDHVYGDLNEYYAEAAARYPGRFIPLAQIWGPEALTGTARPRRRRVAAVGQRQPLRDVAVVHLPAVDRLHPCALRLSFGDGKGGDPGRQCRPAVRPGARGAAKLKPPGQARS